MFLSPNHEVFYKDYLQRDGTDLNDRERQALFYIFAGYEEITDKVEYFYDFREQTICPEGFEKVHLTSSSKSLIILAFNLYNNYPMNSIIGIFTPLDEQNQKLALNAIRIRFSIKE